MAVGVTLLLFSIVDMWKLQFSLAPYTVTAGIGVLTLEVVIRKYWVTHGVKKCWKLESPCSRLQPEKGQEQTNQMGIFNLPCDIQVMISNYRPLQTIFAIAKCECCTQKIKKEEQFSPTVTIVDAVTKQPLDCVLLLRGEKPPEVSCRTLFCYIAVQVSQYDAFGSHLYLPYHMGSKPCKQGKLPLIFCFYQPGTVCNIQLSVHSIVDSEEVEYMYQSEDFTCVVQIVDRDQYGGMKMKGRHGVVRMKEPPRLKYTGALATKQFHKLKIQFTKWFRTAENKHIQQVSKRILAERNISPDIKAFALCWEALSVTVHKDYECAEELLRSAWEKASKLDCQNGLLLQGKVLRHLAFLQFEQRNDDRALHYLSQARERLFNATPSDDTAHTLFTELLVKIRRLFTAPSCAVSSQLQSFEEESELISEHAEYMDEYEKAAVCNFLPAKAAFYLRSALITLTNELPLEEYWPSPADLRKAEECLNRVSLDIMPSKSNSYIVLYYCTFCDLHIWKQQYSRAMYYLEKARKVHKQVNFDARMQYNVDHRFKLLERLIGDEKIDEILKEYSNTDIG